MERRRPSQTQEPEEWRNGFEQIITITCHCTRLVNFDTIRFRLFDSLYSSRPGVAYLYLSDSCRVETVRGGDIINLKHDNVFVIKSF